MSLCVCVCVCGGGSGGGGGMEILGGQNTPSSGSN